MAAPTDAAAPQAPAVQPAANIRYVDQFGNPVAAPTAQPAVKYVDQFGNPVAAPVGAVSAASTVRYVDQYGNPVAAPVVAARPPIDYRARSAKQQRIAATVFGCLGLFFIIIGFFTDNLARDHDYTNGYDYIFTCRFTKFDKECDDDYYYYSSYSCSDEEYNWSELCDEYTVAFGSGNTPSPTSYYYYSPTTYTGDIPDFCATQSVTSVYLSFTVFAALFALIGTIFAQTCFKVTPCLCKSNPQWHCSRATLLISLLLMFITLIVWFSAEDFCVGNKYSEFYTGDSYSWYYYDGFNVGATVILHIIAGIFIMIAALLARGPEPEQQAASP